MNDDDAFTSDEKRDELGRFIVPPRSPGRPQGARSKLGEAFIQALHDDFQQHGVAAIERVRDEKPDQYLRIVASLMPKDLNLMLSDDVSDLSDEELIDRLRHLDAIIAPLLLEREAGVGEEVGEATSGQVPSRIH